MFSNISTVGGARRTLYRLIQVKDNSNRTDLEVLPLPSRHHHQLEQRFSINDEVQHHQHQRQQLVASTTMDELAALMSQALATVAMASAVSTVAEPTATTTDVKELPLPLPASAKAPTTAPSKSVNTTTTPPQPREQNSNSTFHEANSDNIDLRSFANEIDGRCAAAVKTLHAASRAVISPGEELNHSYEAYSSAFCSLQEAERSVRCAEEAEDAAIGELRRVGEAAEAAEEEAAWAAKSLRAFDAGRGSRSGTAKKKQNSDGDGGVGDGSDGQETPPAVTSDEDGALLKSTHTHSKSRLMRESLTLALETARRNAERASAEQFRSQGEAIAAMTLVGARTAGEWSLAAELCDTARERFQRAGVEAIPKIELFSEEALLFRNLNKLRSDTREKLSAASQAREVARVAAAEAAAMTVARMKMSTPVANAVAVKAAMEAAARAAAHSGEGGENASLSAPAVEQEEAKKEEKEEGEG